MTFPVDYTKAPTDNLYKLMAIGGVVLVVAGFYIAAQHDSEMRQLSVQARSEYAALKSEWEFVKNFSPNDNGATAGKTPVDWTVVDRLRDFARRAEVNNARIAQLNQASAEHQQTLVSGIIAMIVVGLFLAAAGFLLWWFRLQRHQDKLLLVQIKSAEKEAAG